MAVFRQFNLATKIKLIALVCFTLLSSNNLFSECNCIQTGNTHQGSPDAFYTFKDSCVIGICGPLMIINNQPDYYGSCIMDCSDANIINCFIYDEVIRFVFEHDTLKVYSYFKMPNGNNFKLKKNLFGVTYINCINDKVLVKEEFNYKLKKYSPIQIKTILNNYNSINCIDSSDNFIAFADQLLMCYLSGSVEAANLFLKMEDKTIVWNDDESFNYTEGFNYSGYYNSYLWPKYKKIVKYINSIKN